MYNILIKSFIRPKFLKFSYRFISQFNHANHSPIHSRIKMKSSLQGNFCSKSLIFTDEVDIDNEIEEFQEEELKVVSLKNLLYSDTRDEIILKLNKAESSDKILEIFNQHKETFNRQQVVQTIILLWDHLKLQPLPDNELLLKLKDLCEVINKHIDSMTPDELTCSLLYLKKLGLSIKHQTIQNTIEKCLERIEGDGDFPLSSLSRLAVTLNSIRGLYPQLICVKLIPRIITGIATCEDSDSIRLLTVTLNNMHQVITKSVLDQFKSKIDEFLQNGILNNDSVKCVLKIINFLNYPHWSQLNTNLIRKLSLTLIDKIEEFDTRELMVLNRVFQSHLEPSQVVPLLVERSTKLMENNPNVELLASAVLYNSPERRIELTEIAQNFIYSKDYQKDDGYLQTLFKVIRLLKISDTKLCDAYWNKVIQNKKENIDPPNAETDLDNNYQLARYCHRYMHFNNNLGGSYRHKPFEVFLSDLLIKELQNGISSFIPSRFAKFSSFLIAYYWNPERKHTIPSFIVQKIESMQDQFNIVDCLQLSRGVQILLEMRYRYFIPDELASQLVVIEGVLNNCTERHIKNDNLTMSDINCIIRSYNNRKSSKKTYLFDKLMKLYENPEAFQLNSRSIRDITFNLNVSYRVDKMCQALLDYIEDNSELIAGDTVEKIIYCCYNLGYFMPESEEESKVFQKCSEIVLRDFQFMSGLSIIQACLALVYFKSLPERLITRVFSIDFIRRLEKEIEMCYSKQTYPERVLNQVMQLNRAVCLDYPELNIPWFQQNYLEAQMSKMPVITTKFNMDVRKLLLDIVPEAEFLKINHVTHYGYRIDFLVYVDQITRQFIRPADITEDRVPKNVSKVAILLLKSDSFTGNDENGNLKGSESFRSRHIEMLGYRVLSIKVKDWNSLYMSIKDAKINYLKSLLGT